MKKTDILGTAINEYYTGDKNKLFVLSDQVGVDEMPVEYFFRNFNEMPELERHALKACKGRVLDVGAGAGSHALWLQNKKFNVTAIDQSKGCFAVMQKRGLSQVINQDVFDFNDDKFDTILLLMNGLGIAKTLDELPVLLDRLKQLLNDNGQILFDSTDLKYLYADDDGSMLIDLNAPYYGEVSYRYKYKNSIGNWFNWLYIDEFLMEEYAAKANLKMEIIFRSDAFNYLAKLSFISH